MQANKYYILGSKLSSSTFQAAPQGLKDDLEGTSDEHKLIKGQYDGITFPVCFKQVQGTELKDLLDTGWAGLFLMSEKFKEVLITNELSGWKTFEVGLFRKDGSEVKGYIGLSITGSCGKVDYSKAASIEKRLVPNGPIVTYRKGMPLDFSQWDGSDLFLPEGTVSLTVTERAKNLMSEASLSNLSFHDLDEVETPDFAFAVKRM